MSSRESREGRDDYAVSSGDDSEYGRRVASDASPAVEHGPLRPCWWGAPSSGLEAALEAITAELSYRAKAESAEERAARKGQRGRKALHGEDSPEA